MSSSKILNYGVDLYRLNVNDGGRVDILTNNGEVFISGDLRVEGSLISIESQDLLIVDNTIVINKGEQGSGVSRITSGIEVDRGQSVNVNIVFDESIGFLNPETALLQPGAFKFSDVDNNLIGVYTNSINTFDNQNLMINTPVSGVITVRPEYKTSVFLYSNNTINTDIFVENALVNVGTMIDYVKKVVSDEVLIIGPIDGGTY